MRRVKLRSKLRVKGLTLIFLYGKIVKIKKFAKKAKQSGSRGMKKRVLSKKTKTFLSYILVLVGSFIFAVSTYMFLVPAKLIPGGMTGFASMVEAVFKFPAQYTILIINVPILFCALFLLDKKFAVRTIFGIVCVSGFMELFSRVGLYKFVNTNQPLISAIISGTLSGTGIGLLLNSNASPGGTEVIGMLIKKKLKDVKLSYILFGMNVLIMSISAIMFIVLGDMEIEELLILLVCSIIQSMISSKTVDMILNGIYSAVKFEIVTKKDQEVCKAILKESEYGVTIIESKGAYFEEKSKMLICIVPKLRIPDFKKIIQESDPDAFVFSINTREVMGKNFKRNR